jgi:hypothetical protein
MLKENLNMKHLSSKYPLVKLFTKSKGFLGRIREKDERE